MLCKLPLFAASLLESAPFQKAGEREERDRRLGSAGARGVLLDMAAGLFELGFPFRRADLDVVMAFAEERKRHLRFFLSSARRLMDRF